MNLAEILNTMNENQGRSRKDMEENYKAFGWVIVTLVIALIISLLINS